MNTLNSIANWFTKAKPEMLDRDVDVQIGCHLEEAAEMLESLKGRDGFSEATLRKTEDQIKLLATALKCGYASCLVYDRKEFLDALADQIVTAVGCGVATRTHILEALDRVDASNWSKFGPDGVPIFDENGKIAKNMATYKKPDLTGLY